MNFDTAPHTESHNNASESSQRIFYFLKMHPVGVLATVGQDNLPQASVIYYSVDEDFTITFTTKRDTKKRINISEQNHVQLVVFEASSQTTVQISGTAEIISNPSEASEVFGGTLKASVRTSESGVPPISKLFAGNYVAFKIKPKQIRMAVFMRPDPGDYEIFETLDF